MRKLNLLGNVIKSSGLSPTSNQSLSSILRLPLRSFSVGGEEHEPSSPERILQQPNRGLIYGRLTGIGRNTLKTDIIHFLEGCNLSTEDIKVDYDRAYTALGISFPACNVLHPRRKATHFIEMRRILQFPSRTAFDSATRLILRKGRLYKLEKVDRGQWDSLTIYGGKVALVQGFPRNALQEDVERFLSGCDFDASKLQLLTRQTFPEFIRLVLVHFPSQIEATNAIRMKNRGFILNNPISMRLLQ